MEFLQRLQLRQLRKIKSPDLLGQLQSFRQKVLRFIHQIKAIGVTGALEDYEKRKLEIFNLLNLFQLITGILIPLTGLLTIPAIPAGAWIVAAFPAIVSFVAILLNSQFHYRSALIFYFIFYPLFTGIVYFNGINLGVELSFVLYGILSVFFLQEIGYMVFSIGLSMISYFILAVVLKDYRYQLKSISLFYYLLHQALAIAYIFYGLYLIKRENTGYQLGMIRQKAAMGEQAVQLKKQADELVELNTLNNKLFSIISHDLKAPMYALRNFFHNAKEHKLPAKEIRDMLPDVINDLNYTTSLMENLLHWAKSQMQSNTVRPQQLDMNKLIHDVIQLLRIQADAKKIIVEMRSALPVSAYADRDMVDLVLRNLLSNAIKYTPAGGRIIIGTNEHDSFTEAYITDSGRGITREDMKKINENNFYTTPGTSSEAGTGLGLMICKEFLARNNGQLMIESEPGKGSTFSFTLPQL